MSEERTTVGGVAVATGHFINNVRVSSHSTFEDRSPLDWSLKLADIARGSAHDADLAVSAAQAAFPTWAALSVKQRAKYLHRLADLIDENIEGVTPVQGLVIAMLPETLSPAA